MDALLCGESRSGPDLLKLGWHMPPVAPSHGAPKPHRIQCVNRVRGDPGLCSWIELVAERSGARKRAVFDEAAGFGGPGTSVFGGSQIP